MGAVLLLALSMGLGVYAGIRTLPRYSARAAMIRRLGGGSHRGKPVPWSRWLVCGCVALLLAPWLLFGTPPDWGALLVYPPVLSALPALWRWLQARRRRALLTRAYPDLLAHLGAQTRAGAGTLQAFATSPPVLQEPLRSEVQELIADLRVAPFPAALQRFAERCGTPEIESFARNIIYQQSLGIALAEALAAEERHALSLARQEVRQRIQRSAVVMASVTVILLLNGLLVYFTPGLYDLFFTGLPREWP